MCEPRGTRTPAGFNPCLRGDPHHPCIAGWGQGSSAAPAPRRNDARRCIRLRDDCSQGGVDDGAGQDALPPVDTRRAARRSPNGGEPVRVRLWDAHTALRCMQCDSIPLA